QAWGYDVVGQRVIWSTGALPWPHYFVDLSGIGGSTDPGGNTVILTDCAQRVQSGARQICQRPQLVLIDRSGGRRDGAGPGTAHRAARSVQPLAVPGGRGLLPGLPGLVPELPRPGDFGLVHDAVAERVLAGLRGAHGQVTQALAGDHGILVLAEHRL